MFSETIRARLRGHHVQAEVLAELKFTSRTMYVHNGGGTLLSKSAGGALEAIQWQGLDGKARVSGLGASSVGNARSVTVGLDAGDDEIRILFGAQEAEVRDRPFVFWGQFYDENLAPLDPRFHLYTGFGDKLRMQKQGPSSRAIDLFLEDALVRRRRSANSVVSHADQQLRDPGSTGFVYAPEMADKILNLFDAGD
jgi:hypothetical protein